MAAIRVISESTIFQAGNHTNFNSSPTLDLTPWDLQFLHLQTIQKGLLFHYPTPKNAAHSLIPHLKQSLSSTLDFFPPLAGRLVVTHHHDGAAASSSSSVSVSVSIACNNAGVSFVHAAAMENIRISDVLGPTYVPHNIVHSFFPLNDSKNIEATSKPLMAVQVTELEDGIFVGCSMNHCLADGTSFWHFLNSWAEVSRDPNPNPDPNRGLSKPPSFERWFLEGIEPPIRIPSREIDENPEESDASIPQLRERVFHFTREKIAELKEKANTESSSSSSYKISSLQAVLGHVWRSVIRTQNLDPQEEVTYGVIISGRSRITNPPIPQNFFGMSLQFGGVTMKAGDLVGDGGLGRFGMEMKKMIGLYNDDKFKRDFESWVREPKVIRLSRGRIGKFLGTSSSPRFDFYGGNDFGWGRPVAVRSGPGNKGGGKLTVYGGAEEEGSMDIELCISYEILEAMGRDPEFMDAVSMDNSHD